MAFGKKLLEILNSRKISVYQLSKETSIPSTTLHAIIKRDSNNVNMDTIQKIADYLGMSVDDLLGFNTKRMVADGKKLLEDSKEALLVSKYRELNSDGKSEAIKRVDELTEIKKYTE